MENINIVIFNTNLKKKKKKNVNVNANINELKLRNTKNLLMKKKTAVSIYVHKLTYNVLK